jgi:pimeloyl-ACP methyl ester carboxylesterase
MQSTPHTRPGYAKANGIELCYETFGNASAEPLLLIMGLGAQMTLWDDDFCTGLAAHGFYVIRFDNRDAGLSTRVDAAGTPDLAAALLAVAQGKPVDAPYQLGDMAQDAVGLMDALAITSAHVVGASMGGAIAQMLAIHHPTRLRTLTSIMATTGAPGLPPPTPQALEVLFNPVPIDLPAYIENYAHTWKVLRAGCFPLDEARDIVRARQNFERGLNPAGVARQMMAILSSGSRKRALATVRVRTLVIHGDVDPLVPLACGIDTADSVPGSKLLVVRGMGHALPIPMWPTIIDAIATHAG